MYKTLALFVMVLSLFTNSAAAAFKLNGDPKIAMIFAASAQDGGWNEAFDNARKIVEETLDLKIATTESVQEETTKIKAAIDLYVRRGYNIIIGTGFGYSDGFLEAAKQYPEVAFLNGAGVTNHGNLESFYARTYEGWYLAGMIAGSQTETNKLGMMGGFPIGLVNWDINAFILGTRATNPSNETIVIYSNSWWDPAKERQIAEAMLDENADVISTDLSAASVLKAAEDAGKKSVGFQLDMSKHAPNGHIASVTFRWENYLIPAIGQIVEGTWEPSEWGAFVGMDQGVVELAGIPDSIDPQVMRKVEDAKKQMSAGKFSPFTGPIRKQDGSTLVAAGETLDDGALWEMNYFVEGAIGKMPSSE
jgi:basic membrane protein A